MNGSSPFTATARMTLEDVPKAQQAKFFGVPEHEVHAIAKDEASALAYYASQGSTQGQTHQKQGVNRGPITLSFQEARKLAQSNAK